MRDQTESRGNVEIVYGFRIDLGDGPKSGREAEVITPYSLNGRQTNLE